MPESVSRLADDGYFEYRGEAWEFGFRANFWATVARSAPVPSMVPSCCYAMGTGGQPCTPTRYPTARMSWWGIRVRVRGLFRE